MLRFFTNQDNWKCDPGGGPPPPKAMAAQLGVLRSSKAKSGVKVEVLKLITRLATLDDGQPDDEVQDTYHGSQVTPLVCSAYTDDTSPPEVQAAAARALAALCRSHEGNADSALSDDALLPTFFSSVLNHAPQHDVALASLELITSLATSATEHISHALLQPGGLSKLIQVALDAARTVNAPSTKSTTAASLEALLAALLAALWACCAHGGARVCGEASKAQGLQMLLEVARTQAHAGARECALGLLALLMEQVPGARARLTDVNGMRVLLGLLRDLQLPWPAKQAACQALACAAANRSAAEDIIQQKGIDDILRLCDGMIQHAFPPSGGITNSNNQNTPGGGAGAAAPPSPARSHNSPAVTPNGSAAGPSGRADYAALEDLVAVMDAVCRHAALAGAVAEQQRAMGMLQRLLTTSLSDFRGGGYRLATAVAQVYQTLASHADVREAVLGKQSVQAPLGGLLERGSDHGACDSSKSAQVVHGAWAAAGALCGVWLAAGRRAVEEDARSALTVPAQLPAAVKLLRESGDALMRALDPAGGSMDITNLAGSVYLQTDRARASIQSALAALTDLLALLAGQAGPARQALVRMEAADAVRKLKHWPPVQLSAKRMLACLGDGEVEYQPFGKYSPDLLLELLGSQGVPREAFMQQGGVGGGGRGRARASPLDPHILLGLKPEYLSLQLGLDEVQVMKVLRIQDAHGLFTDMDSADGRINGCVAAGDMRTYLMHNLNLRGDTTDDLVARVFDELGVPPEQPICFMQFVCVYHWLVMELQAYVGQDGSAVGAAGGSAGGGGGGLGRSGAKRQKL